MTRILGLLTMGVFSFLASSASAQYPYPPVYGPAPAYYSAPIQAYYSAPVPAYYVAPTVVYRPAYPVMQVAAPVYAPPVVVYRPAPVVVNYPAPVYYRARPYVPGQPVRNVVRAVVW